MKERIIKIWLLSIVALVMTGCASSTTAPFFEQSPPKDYSNMYLRGTFTWFEVDEGFKLTLVDEEQYAVVIKLIADGQPYDFKVADSAWTMTLNCGASFGSEPIELKDSRDLVCASDSLNLQFTPQETGLYQFLLDVSDNDSPELTIVRVD